MYSNYLPTFTKCAVTGITSVKKFITRYLYAYTPQILEVDRNRESCISNAFSLTISISFLLPEVTIKYWIFKHLRTNQSLFCNSKENGPNDRSPSWWLKSTATVATYVANSFIVTSLRSGALGRARNYSEVVDNCLLLLCYSRKQSVARSQQYGQPQTERLRELILCECTCDSVERRAKYLSLQVGLGLLKCMCSCVL